MFATPYIAESESERGSVCIWGSLFAKQMIFSNSHCLTLYLFPLCRLGAQIVIKSRETRCVNVCLKGAPWKSDKGVQLSWVKFINCNHL